MFPQAQQSNSFISSPRSTILNPYILKWLEHLGHSSTDFFSLTQWDLKKLPEFRTLKDMDKAVTRILLALKNQESIAVFGDYDVDGTTSCALLFRFFKKIGTTIKVYQPSRFVEGYGLNPISVEQAHKDGVKLLITVDCGMTSFMAGQRAHELGIDLIITDHHKDSGADWPMCCALINPNRRDEVTSPMQALAGVGVAFALSLCVREELISHQQSVDSIYDLLPYVAIGTISDLAHLNAMNLLLCRHGFKALLLSKDLGLRKFLEKKELTIDYLESEIISFYIGPMINSKGRLDHPEIALELLISESPQHINEHFEKLSQTNHHRKKIQQEVYEEAKKDILQEIDKNPKLSALIVYRPHWHEGVIGIVASKLVEEFHRPALVFTNSEHVGTLKASVRTALNIDIFEQLKIHEQYFIKFGGHKAAAGLTLAQEQFEDFKNSFLSAMTDFISRPHFIQSQNEIITPILDLHFSEINGQLIKDIYQLAPFGQGHPMPKWRIRGARIQSYDILKDLHIRWKFTEEMMSKNTSQAPTLNLNGISFNFLKKNSLSFLQKCMDSEQELLILAWIKINTFKGSHYIQLVVDQLELH